MNDFLVEATRSGLTESQHRVSLAVCDANGKLRAWTGNPKRVTFWRSAAKPFQAMPFVEDGAFDAFGMTSEMLALACASHSSEALHRKLCLDMLSKIGATENDLSCGPHPLSMPSLAEEVLKQGTPLTPAWSNCSGKHAAMLAWCRHQDKPFEGYARQGHPLQNRILQEVSRWTNVPASDIGLGVDGCTAVCFALPLQAMAWAYARLATSDESTARRIREAMTTHPSCVAGQGRLCTDLMQAGAGNILAKVGAEGIYCAASLEDGLGLALKVESGDGRASKVALLEILQQLGVSLPYENLRHHARVTLLNTRDEPVGELRPNGKLHWA